MMSKFSRRINAIWKERIKPFINDPLFLNKWYDPVLSGRPQQNRLTVWVNSGYKTFIERDDYIGDVFMFEQDMHQFVMPSSRRASERPYSASIEPANATLEALIAKALENRWSRRTLTEALSDFIQEAAQSLFYYGKAVYELSCDKDAEGNITRLDIFLVYPPTIKKVFGRYWQIVTWKAAKHGRIKAGMKHIPSERLLYIDFPKQLGGRRGLVKVIKELAFISKEILPDFQMEAMKNQTNSGFNFNEYVWDRYIMKGKITRTFGWNQRKAPDNDMLEYHGIYRHLNLAKSQAIIREHIVEQLNRILSESYVGIESKLVPTNLLTPKQIDEEMNLFKQGGLEFVKLYERTSGL